MVLLEKNDEWFTQQQNISDEVEKYKTNFIGKTVYCNCDDTTSEFYKYFKKHFNELNLRKLYCTSIKGTITVFNGNEERTKRMNNGSFQYNENLISKCDIVVSNPPFSMFKEYITMLIRSGKKFLILGPVRSSYGLMQYFDNGDMHFGTAKSMGFNTPDGQVKMLGNCGWFTNLKSDMDIERRTRQLKDSDFTDGTQDVIEIPAMYMPNIDDKGILHTSNGDYKKLPGGRRVGDNQRIRLQKITEKVLRDFLRHNLLI